MERQRLRPLIALAALITAFLAVDPLAAAQPAQAAGAPSAADLARARALFAQGENAARAGRWSEAIERFEKVRAIKETPGVVFHLAAAHEGAGRLAEALLLFERARDLAGRAAVADVLALAEERVASLGHRVPRLVVRVPSPDESAEVRLDGAPLDAARWGETTRVDPGSHRVEASFRGEPFLRTVTLAEGASITVIVGDASAPTASPAASPPPPPAGSGALPATGLAAPSSFEEQPSSGAPVGPIVLGASGLLLAGGGVVSFVVAGSENAAAGDACAAGDTACDPGARDTVRALDGLALGLWIGGAAAIGGAAVWWALDDGSDGGIEARAGLGPRGATLRGRF